MQQRLGAAKHIQALIFLLSSKLDASWYFLANFLVILNRILHLNFTDGFGEKSLTLDSDNGLQILSKPLLFLFYQVFLLGSSSHLQTLYITNSSSEEEPRQFLICHHITEQYTQAKVEIVYLPTPTPQMHSTVVNVVRVSRHSIANPVVNLILFFDVLKHF